MKTFTSLTATAVLAVLALNVAQAADTPYGIKSLTVSFADLNLAATTVPPRCMSGSGGRPKASAVATAPRPSATRSCTGIAWSSP